MKGKPSTFGSAVKQAEESVIGSILLHGLAYNDAADILEMDGTDFYEGILGKVWAAMGAYARRLDGKGAAGIDLVTVAAEMRNLGTFSALKFQGEEVYLSTLANNSTRWDNVREHAALIKKESQYRKSSLLATRLADQIGTPVEDIPDQNKDEKIQETLSELNHVLVAGGGAQIRRVSEVLHSAISFMEAGHQAKALRTKREIGTGNDRLDAILDGGYQVPCYSIVAARPSMGKTAVMTNQILTGAKQGIPHLVLSLEMEAQPIIMRMMAVQSGGKINSSSLKKPELLTSADWIQIAKVAGEIAALPIVIEDFVDKSKSADSVIATIERWRSAYRRLDCPICLTTVQASMTHCPTCRLKRPKRGWPFQRASVWIDHFGLIPRKMRHGMTAESAASELSIQFATMSKRLNLSLTLLCQLNRKVEERKDKRPLQSDLRETGSLEQDADLITMLYRDEYYDRDTKDRNILELIVHKNRNGDVGVAKAGWEKDKGPRVVNLKD